MGNASAEELAEHDAWFLGDTSDKVIYLTFDCGYENGYTEKILGYVHLNVKPVLTQEITIRLKGSSSEEDAFGQIVEVAAPVANELDLYKADESKRAKYELRIVEIEFLENLLQ